MTQPNLSNFSIASKTYGTDTTFSLTDPTSNSSGAFTFTSGNTQVATISGRTVTIIGPGTSVITASQAAAGGYAAASTTASLVVEFGNLTSLSSKVLTDGPFVIPAPTSNVVTTYGTTWNQLGANIYGENAGDNSGYSVSMSADGTIVAIGAFVNDGSGNLLYDSGHIRVYKYTPGKGAVTNQNDASFGPVGWTRLGADIDGEAVGDRAGGSVSLSADGTVVAIGAQWNDGSGNGINDDRGHVRVYKYNPNKTVAQLSDQSLSTFGPAGWDRLGADIDGESDDTFSFNVSLSADGTVVAIGAFRNDGSGNGVDDNRGHVRVYKYTPGKAHITNQNDASFGPVGWTRLGADIDGETAGDYSGFNVSLSADGTTVAIGAIYNDGSGNLLSNSGHVRVYKYTPGKADVTNQNDTSFGPVGWTRLGADIDGEAYNTYSSWSVSLSADGTTVAIGAHGNDGSGNLRPYSGHTRVYKYTPGKGAVTNQNDAAFGPIGWTRLGADIDGEAAGDNSGYSVSMSSDGTVVAIGAPFNNDNRAAAGQVRIYKYNPNKTVAQLSDQSLSTFGPAGWDRLGADIDGDATVSYDQTGNSVSLSADGTTVAIGAIGGTSSVPGTVRVFKIDSSGNYTYTIGNSTVADICGNIVLPKLGGSTTINVTQSASGANTSKSATVPLTIIASPTFQTYTVASKTYGTDTTFSLTDPTSNSSGAFSYTSSNAAVATVTSGGVVTVVGVGSATITATQDATTNYLSGSVTASLVVSAIAPTFGTFTVPGKNFRDAAFSLTAPTTDSSGAFTYTSNTPSVATVTSGGVVTVVGAGSATISAVQDACGNFTSGTVTGVLVVSAIAPTFGTFTVPGKNFGDAAFSLTAPTTDSSGAFTYSSNAPSVATVTSGGVVTVVGAGSATITATQDASGNYQSGSVSSTLTVNRATPTYQAVAEISKTYGIDVSFSLTTVVAGISNSSGAYTFSSASGAVSISGAVVTILAYTPSAITITAAQDASGNYAGSSTTMSLLVGRGEVTYQSVAQITKTYSTDVSFSLTSIMAGVSNSSGAYTFSSASNAIDICGGVATIIAYTPSAITITASQGASGNYTASSTTFTLLISRKTPSYGEFSIPAKTYGDVSFSVVPYAPTTDSLSVPYTYTSSDPAVATINSNGTVVTIIGQGYTTITASQEASGNYAANSSTSSFLVNRAAPTFLKAFTIPDKTFGDASFSLLPFTEGLDNTDGTYHFTSSNSELVSISNTDDVTATIHAYTPTPITIYVAIDACGNYAASSTSGTLNVGRDTPTIGTLTAPPKNFRATSFTLSAPTSDSSGAFTYTIDASGVEVASVTSGGLVTVIGVGNATITATQAVSGNYTSGSVSATLVVSPIAPTFGTFTVPGKLFRDASFNLTAPTTDSSGTFTYTINTSGPDAGVATVTSGGVVTVVGVGSATITATQGASGNFTARTITGVLVVSAIAPTFGTFTVPTKNFRDTAFSLTAPSTDSSGAFTYTIDASESSVATVTSGGLVTVVGVGSATISVVQDACGNFTSRTVTGVLVVSAIAPTFGTFTVPTKNFRDTAFSLTAPTTDSSGSFTYSSNTPSVATVTSGGLVTVVGAGSATISVVQDACGNFTTRTVTGVLVVSPISPTIGALTVPAKNFGDAAFSLSAPTTDSSGSFTYTINTSGADAGVATVTSGGVVTIVGAGSATITATQDACGNFTTRTVTGVLVVSVIAPTYQSITQITKTYSTDVSFSLTSIMAGVSNSSGAYTFSSASNAIDICGGVATILAYTPSAITITASQGATINYTASSTTFTLLISRKTPSYGEFSIPAKTYGDVSFSVVPYAPTTDSLSVPYTYTSSDPAVATINSNGTVVTIIGQGYTTITASQEASGNYAANSSTSSFLVNRAAPTFLKAFTIPDKTFGDASFSLLPFTEGLDNTDGTYHFTSSNSELVSISNTDDVTATIHAYTPTPITIYVAIDACGNYAASSTSGTLNVDRAAPTIGTLTAPPKNFRDASFTLSAPTSDSSGAFTYTSSNTAVATVTSGGLVTVVGAGSATITATLAASGNYTSGSVTAALVVSPIAPTFGTFTVPGKNFRDASFNLTAPTTDSSGVFTYSSNAPSVATVTSGGRVTVVGTGSATITATQDASGNFTARTVTAALVVSPIAPTFGTFTVPGKNFRDAAFSLTAPTTDSSGAFTYSSNAPTVATVTSGGLVTVVGAGSATISVVQDACGNFTARTVTGVLVVSPIEPTFGTFTVPTKNFRAAAFSLTAPITDSSGAFIYTIDASESGVATVTSDGRVTVVGAGSAIITTTQDACGNFTARTVTGMLVVSSIEPTFGTFTVPPKNYRDDAFSLTAPTTDSSGAFTYNSSSYWVATVTSGGVVTIVGTGRTSISATQASSGNFTSRTVTGVLVISPIAPSFGTFTVPPKYFNDSTFYLTRPTTDSFGSSIYYSSNTPSVATVTYDGSVTMTGVGSTTITATQGATDNFTSGTVTGVLVVSPATPVITLSTITKNYGDASFNIQPSSTNTDVTGYNGDGLGRGLISFSSGNSNIVTIFDTSYVGIVGIGSANITMSQTATTNFTSGSGTVMATINKGTPVLSAFTVSSNRTYGSAPFSALALPTSAGDGAITYSQSDANIATIDNSGVITLLAAGYVTFTATQASTAFYNLVTKASNTMTVHKQALPLTRVSPTSSIINKIYGDSYFNVSATNASNGGAITYETDNSSVCGVINESTGVISVVSVGTATITARRVQTAQYTSDPVSWTVEVARATTTLTGLVDLSYNVTSAPFTVTASSPSNGAVTYSLQSPSSEVLTIHPTTGRITLLMPGTAVIVASQAQSSLYLATANITATITVTSAGSALQGATLTSTSSFASVDLSGASLAGVTISNTTFNAAKLSNANLTNAVIVSANFTSANLTGATLAGATITGATFTSASLKNADLSGATLTSTVFTGSDLSGARLTGVDASGASFANAKLNNVDMTGANVQNVNFTNTSIKGAIIADISFSPLQKLQLLKNSENRDIGQIIIPAVSGTTILSAISETSPLRAIANLDLTSASVSVAVVIPTTSTSPTEVLPDVVLNVTDNDKFYLPINEGEYFQIDGVKYSTSGGVVRNYVTNAVVEVIQYGGKPVWLLAGSIVGLVLLTNSLNTASFVVPSHLVFTNLTPFMPTTLPTTNSESTIVYSSNNTYIASINSSSGLITLTGHTGVVSFTATQVQNSTHEPGSITSNYMTVGTNINFSLIGLNQSFNLSTLALLDSSSVNLSATDAAAIFYVRLSDINNVFKYQTDATDVNDISSSDIKYYVFHRKWPAELKINPSHAMMNKAESVNSLGSGEGYTSNKSLMKHDFIRYIALRLFNTIHGVDLFRNESDILENSVYWGETVRHNIDGILSGISTTSNSETMPYDASGNKYLTNDSSGNTNLSRELMRQVAAGDSSRFYNNGENNSGLKNIPFLENDTIIFKVILQAAAGQNILTGVSEIPSRSYTVKLVLKNTVTAGTNANTVIVDSEMYPNSYPYSSSVTTYAPTSESSGVYNIYSPPAPIPFSRFGFNGWYYMNSSAWVGVAPAVRNHIKWIVSANTGSSTVGDIQYVRLNLKIHNNASLPYLMIYTQAGSSRKYAVSGGNGSLTNGTVYSLYINLNSYTREPAITGYTNAALVYTIGSGTFANNESITSFAVETDSNATASNVEFTLASIIVGELSTTTGVTTEKEYGFEADIPVAYP